MYNFGNYANNIFGDKMKYNKMNSNKIVLIIIVLAFLILNVTIIYGISKNNYTKDNFFRIHVVANSDSINDQIIKYRVAEKVNNYISEITENVNSNEETKDIITNNITNILSITKNELKENNCNDNIKAHIGSINYEEKEYNNIYFEPGIYTSLKIVIGDGNGQNFWSLVYPRIDMEDENITFSFKIIDFLKNIFKI